MNGWFEFTEVRRNMIAHLFFEVKEDRIVRQVEQYGDCWVYSGNPNSFCLDSEGMEVFGNRIETDFSSMRNWELPPSMQKRHAEFEQGWSEIDAGVFETAWATASRLAVHRSDERPSEGHSQAKWMLKAITVEQREELFESMQRLIDTCKQRLERPDVDIEDRQYLEKVMVNTSTELERLTSIVRGT